MATMYTKMTATGSSVITTPRTISKELEGKITAVITALVTKHDIAQLGTKFVREQVEKEVKVNLAKHKELLKRLLLQEIRRFKTEKAAKRVTPQPWKIKTRYASATKGLHCVFKLLREDLPRETSVHLDAMQSLYDLQLVERGEITRIARTYARLLGSMYLHGIQQHASEDEWPAAGTVPTPQQVVSMVAAVYSVERLGISHPRRMELFDFLRTQKYTATDYFGWDPAKGAPQSNADGSAYRHMANALLQCWYAQSLQVSLGCTVFQLLQGIVDFYPYKSAGDVSATEYRDQVHLVTTLVLVLTRFGALKCEPELLPHEYYFLRQHLVVHIVRQDVALVSEILRALRCFDGSSNLVSVRRGMALIMLSQQQDGSWQSSPTGDTVAATERYHSTMNSIVALCEPRSLGFAPSMPELLPLLQLHANAELPAAVVEDERMRRQHESASSSSSQPPPESGQSEESKPPVAPSQAAATEAPASDDLETQVRFLQGMLEQDGGNVKQASAALAMHVLTTLSEMALTVEILKSTGIGRVINKLRKHSSEPVAAAATQLIAKWKKALL
ncbi:hypothetical protein P43SY_003788 [Pythium insidiosum]|uniref:TFIIS N-terminal domain-containing protein n=1 Tax=Pythium insidiosum TaxID=114742 RepID=A0AAD5QA79_PYTIN|nr:hypothetical protein P43SY_003788 [Pythium insidiosum]